MIEYLLLLFLILSCTYFIFLSLIVFGLTRLTISQPTARTFVSVVISARNEEHRIIPTLESLEKIDYPVEKFEIILVDDASTDRTAEIINTFAEKHENWSLICLKEKSSVLKGKKRALKEAIEKARGEIIFTTDADCCVLPNWIRKMAGYFDAKTSMVLGHSPIQPGSGIWHKILEFDNLFSAVLGSAPTKLGFPITSVGRNLAYRKSVYLEIGGFEALKKFRSGDDVHLTERFRGKSKGKIEFCADPDTFVMTLPPSTNREIFHQQIRKNSKILNKSIASVIFSIAIFLIFISFISLPLIIPAGFILWLKVILIKQILEFIVLAYAARIFRKRSVILYIPIMQIVYPFYIIFFSVLGILQIYEWKK